MKKILMLAVCGAALAMAGVGRAETYNKSAAITVVGVTGEARYSVDGKEWHPLVAGKILRAGAVLETAAGSSADLVISGMPVPVPENITAPGGISGLSVAPDPIIRGYETYKPMVQQNVIRMSSGTMLAVDKLTEINTGADTVGDTELDLRAGKIFVNVKKMSASSQYIVKLPNGVAGIRGSCGSIGANGSVEWLSGLIYLSLMGPNGPVVIPVHGGFDYDPSTGQISHMTPSIESVLRSFGIFAETLYAKVTVVQTPNGTVIYISPTEGFIFHRRPV